MKIALILILMLFLMPLFLAAQIEDVPFDVDKALVQAILGVFSIGVLGLTQLIKNLLKTQNWAPALKKIGGYVISLVVSAGGTAYVLATRSTFELGSMILYTMIVWAIANGWWKGLKELIAKHK